MENRSPRLLVTFCSIFLLWADSFIMAELRERVLESGPKIQMMRIVAQKSTPNSYIGRFSDSERKNTLPFGIASWSQRHNTEDVGFPHFDPFSFPSRLSTSPCTDRTPTFAFLNTITHECLSVRKFKPIVETIASRSFASLSNKLCSELVTSASFHFPL